jgi:hypothetical protein
VKFSNAKQIIGLLVAWALTLLVIDQIKDPRPLTQVLGKPPMIDPATNLKNPHLTIFLNHLCCTGCLGDVREALAKLTWLGKVDIPDEQNLLPQEKAGGTDVTPQSLSAYGNRLEVDIKKVEDVDFVALEKALREVGFVAERIDFGGVRHYRLEAELNHVCCDLCAKGAQQGLEIAQALRTNGASIKWLDSVQVSKEKKKIVAHARFDAVVDVVDFMSVLGHIGYAPSSLTVQADSENPTKAPGQP